MTLSALRSKLNDIMHINGYYRNRNIGLNSATTKICQLFFTLSNIPSSLPQIQMTSQNRDSSGSITNLGHFPTAVDLSELDVTDLYSVDLRLQSH